MGSMILMMIDVIFFILSILLAHVLRYFLGEWLDNLGHKIVVSPASQRFGRNQRQGRAECPVSHSESVAAARRERPPTTPHL